MTGLLFIVFICIYLSIIFERKISDILPPFVFTLLVALYYLAIIGYSHHSFFLTLIASVFVFILFFIRFKRIVPTPGQLKQKLLPSNDTGFYVYLIVCIVMAYCYHTHFVLVWDDFHYNANFPKDMWYFGTMPKGVKSTTYYKDYFPTLQLFYYWGFQSIRRFSEPLMFIYKIILAYTCMLPFFAQADKGSVIKRCISVVIAVILPFIPLIEILDSLSMDACLALIFAYAVISVMSDDKKDWFYYYKIVIALNALVLFKSYALIFACITLFMWFVRLIFSIKEIKAHQDLKKGFKTDVFVFAGACATVLISFISWKLFCSRNGNSTYLSGILSDNIKSGGINIPDYAYDTAVNIAKSLATMHLNFGKLGFTVLFSLVVCIIAVFILSYNKKCSKNDIISYIVVLCGFIGFYLFITYTYIFIFEDWEAYELSSLDRYLGSYVLTMLYVALFKPVCVCDEKKSLKYAAACIAVVCLVSLNFTRITDALIPSRYLETRLDAYDVKCEVSDEVEELAKTLDNHRGRVLVACNESNSLYSRNMDYYFIPTVTITYDSNEFEKGQCAEKLYEKYNAYDGRYVYFTKRLAEDECFEEFKSLMSDGTELSTGIIYTFNDEGLLEQYKMSE